MVTDLINEEEKMKRVFVEQPLDMPGRLIISPYYIISRFCKNYFVELVNKGFSIQDTIYLKGLYIVKKCTEQNVFP